MINGDAELARRILNKTSKELVAAMVSCKDQETRAHIQNALNDMTFMYDVLHLDEIEVIDINNKSTAKGPQ